MLCGNWCWICVNNKMELLGYNEKFVRVLSDLIELEFGFCQYDKPVIGQEIVSIEMHNNGVFIVIEWQKNKGVSIYPRNDNDNEVMDNISLFLEQETSNSKYLQFKIT